MHQSFKEIYGTILNFYFKEATLSVEMTAKEELRIALEKLKKESQRECDVLAMEV
jgi:hypothetical protein